ncbi:MAG: GNAT family N-acetyltransferase [Chthoniobacteraceae bacterium]
MTATANITVRTATERDARAISALIRRNADAVLAKEYSSVQLAAWKRYNTPVRFRERMKSRTTFGAYRARRLCGTIALEGAELVGFYVNPSCRGLGIGKLLLQRLEAFADSKGIRSLSLTSSPSATTFYSQHGWKATRSVVLSIFGVDFEETLMTKQLAHITRATTPDDIAAIRCLFEEYATWLQVDLSYQGFAKELAALPGCYAAPRGCLALATVDDQPAGCVALRPIDERTCEMKRLHVRAAHQGRGIGRALAERVIAEARAAGYASMVLDTLPLMTGAIRLYESLGFTRRISYYDTPLAETVFFELRL